MKLLLISLILSVVLSSCMAKSGYTDHETIEDVAHADTVTLENIDNKPAESEVPDELKDILIEKVQAMQSVMRWFVYGCDVIGFEQNTQYCLDDGTYYYKINDSAFSEAGIESIDSLKEYLYGYFTVEYVEDIMEQYHSLFIEVDDDLYIIAASAASSFIYKSPQFSAEYVSEKEIRLSCDVMYCLFNNEPEPDKLEFEFDSIDGEWLCKSSPDLSACVKLDLFDIE